MQSMVSVLIMQFCLRWFIMGDTLDDRFRINWRPLLLKLYTHAEIKCLFFFEQSEYLFLIVDSHFRLIRKTRFDRQGFFVWPPSKKTR